MLVPVVPPEEYSKFFSVEELSLILEKRRHSHEALRKTLRRWAENPKCRLRFYYRPRFSIFYPEITFHLEDVLELATRFGYARLTPAMVEDFVAARDDVEPSEEPVRWVAHAPPEGSKVRAAL